MTVLADPAARRDVDLTVLDDAGLADLGRSIGRGRRDLAAFATAVAVEAKRRQESGSSPSPEDLSDPDGEQSQQTQAKDAARGEIREDLPESGAGAESGAARTENADHLAERLSRLSPTEKDRLAAHDREIASHSALLRPEAFRTWLAKLLVEIADPLDDDGLSAAERAMAAAAWTMFHRPDGTWAVAASMDDERGARMDAAVTARAREIANRRPAGQRKITANDRAVAAFELLCGIRLDDPGAGEAQAFRDPGHDNPPAGGTPFHGCEIHHVNTPFHPDGETELHNLVPISTTWHHRIHHGGWTQRCDGPASSHLSWYSRAVRSHRALRPGGPVRPRARSGSGGSARTVRSCRSTGRVAAQCRH